jgi:hypothetical protein
MVLWGEAKRRKLSELRSFGKDGPSTADAKALLKLIDEIEAKVQKTRKAGQYEHYLTHLKERLHAVEKLERYVLTQRLRSEHECTELSTVLASAEKDHASKRASLETHEKRLLLMAHNASQRTEIRTRFSEMHKDLDRFRLRIEHLRTAVKALQTHMREDTREMGERYANIRRIA